MAYQNVQKIKARLDELGVEYEDNAKREDLVSLLEEAEVEVETVEEEDEPEAEDADGGPEAEEATEDTADEGAKFDGNLSVKAARNVKYNGHRYKAGETVDLATKADWEEFKSLGLIA